MTPPPGTAIGLVMALRLKVLRQFWDKVLSLGRWIAAPGPARPGAARLWEWFA